MRKPHLIFSLTLTFLLTPLTASVAGAQPSKLAFTGDEVQINSYTTSGQVRPKVAGYDDGFVVVWQSDGSSGDDTDGLSVQARRLDAAGVPVGDEIQVNSYTTADQDSPAVAAWPDGRFVVVWDHKDFATSPTGLAGRLFAADGAPATDEFLVAAGTSSVNRPAVAVAPDGDSFVVVWPHFAGPYRAIRGQRFFSDGSPSGSAFEIGPHVTSSFQDDPKIAATPEGAFVVVWESNTPEGDDTSFSSIQMRRLDVDGSPVGSAMLVNSYTTNYQERPAVAVGDDGSFVVAWQSYESGPVDPYGIIARRFDSDGTAVGDDLLVNTYTAGTQETADIGALPGGGFLIVWEGTVGSGDASARGVAMRRLDASGTAVGSEFVVNVVTTDDQQHPSVAVSPTGDVLVTWDSDASGGDDGSGQSIQARLLVAEADIGVTLDDGVTTATPGESVTYTLVAGNDGPDAATGVEIEDLLPSGLSCIWTSVAGGGATGNTASSSGDVVETLFLPAGATVTYTLVCDVGAMATGMLTHTATVLAQQVDANASNDSAFDTDTLVPSTDLAITLAAEPSAADPGGMVLLRATVVNLGPSTSAGGTVTAQLPDGLVFAGSTDCVDSMGGVVTCQVSALGPDEEATAEVAVIVDSGVPIGTELTIDATLVADDSDPVASNDTDTTTLIVATAIFQDGFESGDTSMWSVQVP